MSITKTLGGENTLLENEIQAQGVNGATLVRQRQLEINKTMAEIGLASAGIDTQRVSAQKMAAEIGQMAQKLQNETNQVKIQQQIADFQTKWGDTAGDVLKQIISQLTGLIKPR